MGQNFYVFPVFQDISCYAQYNIIQCILYMAVKGQIKPKVDWRAASSPKKQTNKFAFFVFHSKKQQEIHSFVFWENLHPTNLLTVFSAL